MLRVVKELMRTLHISDLSRRRAEHIARLALELSPLVFCKYDPIEQSGFQVNYLFAESTVAFSRSRIVRGHS